MSSADSDLLLGPTTSNAYRALQSGGVGGKREMSSADGGLLLGTTTPMLTVPCRVEELVYAVSSSLPCHSRSSSLLLRSCT